MIRVRIPWRTTKDAKDKENHQEAKDDDDYDANYSSPKTSTIKIITDYPTLEDALDFDSYSKQLADIIRNSTPRFAIGVFGGWGTGKTSLMKMIEANLLKSDKVFNWDRILNYSSDNENLKRHLMENFANLEWIGAKEFMKSPDGKTVEMHDDSNNSLSISINNKTIFASMLINGKPFNNEFIIRKEGDNDGSELNVYKREKDILTVWFNAWKYENEKYLAVVPFLRTIKITLDNDKDSKTGKRWDNVGQALENTFRAFIDSTNISLGMGSYGSTQVNLSKFADVLKADGSAKVSGETVYYHKHVTDYLEDSLSKLRVIEGL